MRRRCSPHWKRSRRAEEASVPIRWRRFRSLFGADPRRDVEDELSFHMEMRTRELIERGESPARARELAQRRFGSLETARTECEAIGERQRRRALRAEFIDERRQDLRYALRTFRRAPAACRGGTGPAGRL
jgi:putative ABC transport system permease protein